MAIIPLRAYNREIEGMIDNQQMDEAVAHCRHILVTFPKHIASYRLLGKAYLEQQRISDATDIFQRVLSSAPDDFISNVGMSIIREDENNLDAAIWHMELAYESQPSNVAIQDELRRLYGRRDGMQPPKVRLTRGALARMYAKGSLYDQAIAELRSAIAEDPNRPDLQLILAEMFFQSSQRLEAVELCANIIKKIPFCLEANKILAVSLPVSEGSEAIRNYRQIVISMDPYYAFAGPESLSSEEVPDNAVNIERLDWKSGIQVTATPPQPNWATSLGISIDKPTEDNLPDWLSTAEAPAPVQSGEKAASSVSPFIWENQEVDKIIPDTAKPESEIPEWMKDAGWQPATGTSPQPPQEATPEEPAAEAPLSEDLEKAEIPDWLKGIAPEGVLNGEKPAEKPKEAELSTPWLDQHQPGPTDSIIHWLEDNQPEKPRSRPAREEIAAELTEDEVPDWLKDLEPTETSATPSKEPSAPTAAFTVEPSAFLEETSSIEAPEAKATLSESQAAPPVETPAAIQPGEAESGLPGMLTSAQTEAAQADQVPEWLKDLAGETTPTDRAVSGETLETAVFEPSQETTPIAEETSSTEQPPVETPAISEPAAAGWIPAPSSELPPVEATTMPEEAPAAAEPIKTEEISASEEAEAIEEIPPGELVAEGAAPTEEAIAETAPVSAEEVPAEEAQPLAEEVVAEKPAVVTGEIPSEVQPSITEEVPGEKIETVGEEIPLIEIPIETEQPMTAAAPPEPEELATTQMPVEAEQPPVSPPPEVVEEQPQGEQPLPAEGELEEVESGVAGGPEALAWLEGLAAEQSAKAEAAPVPVEGGEITPPEWVKLDTEPPVDETVEIESKPTLAAVPPEEVPDWIKGLGEEPEIPPSPEEPIAAVSPELELTPPEELPAWLRELEEPEPEKGEAAPLAEGLEWKADELPAWLKEITESETPVEVPSLEEAPVTTETPAEAPSPAEVPEAAEMPGEAITAIPTPAAGEVPALVEAPEPAEPLAEPTVLVEAPIITEEQMPLEAPVPVETPPAEALPPVELPAVEQVAAVPEEPAIEPASEWTEAETPPAGIKREVLEEAPLEAGAGVPVQEEVAQPMAAVQMEVPPAPAVVKEEQITPAEPPAGISEASLKAFQSASKANQERLVEAQSAMGKGQLSKAVELYSGLVKQNYHLDEIIKDLKTALDRFPVDIELWVTLGDAHFRMDDLPEALSSYIKAEDLVR